VSEEGHTCDLCAAASWTAGRTSSTSSFTMSRIPAAPSPPKHNSLSEVLKPNPHPYAIKTTSTGLLSRSVIAANSTSTPYHYVPSSPSPSPTKLTHSNGKESKHRYSRSLTSDELPRPLPIPPPSPCEDDRSDVFRSSRYSHQGSTRGRPRRSETLPPGSTFPRISLSHTDETNPKQWDPAELAAYLMSALENAGFDLPVHEITAFIQDSEITGRSFLRFDAGVLNACVYIPFRVSLSNYHCSPFSGMVWTQNGALRSSRLPMRCSRASCGWGYLARFPAPHLHPRFPSTPTRSTLLPAVASPAQLTPLLLALLPTLRAPPLPPPMPKTMMMMVT